MLSRPPAAPLDGIRVVCLAIYVPALVAAQRLRAFGASVTVVEPPGGDPLATLCRPWYDALRAGQRVVVIDLKTSDGLAGLEALLEPAELLLTALRPAALERLGLGWPALQRRHRQLSHVAVIGYPAPRENEPGHDLTYQAHAGLLQPPSLPRSLIADLAGAERAAQAALAAIVGQARGLAATRTDVALSDAVDAFGDPLRYGMTATGGVLGGALPGYGLYPTQDGWIAVAALEPHFWSGLRDALGLSAAADAAALGAAFQSRSALEWERWATDRGLPIAAVRPLPA